MSIGLMSAGGAVDEVNFSAGDLLAGKTANNSDGESVTGTMTNNGAWTGTVSPGGSVTVPAGYHNGSGKVSASGITKINLGTMNCFNGGGSINVKSKLPDMYSKLTVDNFFVEPRNAQVNYGVYQIPEAKNPQWNFSKSYNASTGILTIGQMGATIYGGHLHGGLYSCTAYAVY